MQFNFTVFRFMKIALLTVATNKYTDFITKLYASADTYFCKNFDVTYLLFTNNTDFEVKSNRQILKHYIEHQTWPNITLKRYHTFIQYQSVLEQMDYVYYCDADMLFVDDVGSEIISDRVATIHPGFYNKTVENFSFENRPQSKAYIPINKNRKYVYYAGGFNGGKTQQFLNMANVIKSNVDLDSKNNVIARWHDESHMNYYFNIITQPTLELSPSYCYPESWNLPFHKKLLALDKKHKEYQV